MHTTERLVYNGARPGCSQHQIDELRNKSQLKLVAESTQAILVEAQRVTAEAAEVQEGYQRELGAVQESLSSAIKERNELAMQVKALQDRHEQTVGECSTHSSEVDSGINR